MSNARVAEAELIGISDYRSWSCANLLVVLSIFLRFAYFFYFNIDHCGFLALLRRFPPLRLISYCLNSCPFNGVPDQRGNEVSCFRLGIMSICHVLFSSSIVGAFLTIFCAWVWFVYKQCFLIELPPVKPCIAFSCPACGSGRDMGYFCALIYCI